MVAGLVLFAAVLALQAAAALWSDKPGSALPRSRAVQQGNKTAGEAKGPQPGRDWLGTLGRLQLLARVGRWRLPVPAFRAWLAGTALAHCLGIFSFFYLLSEGKGLLKVVVAACAGP